MATQATTTYYTELDSPIGVLLITSNGSAITGVCMQDGRPAIGDHWQRNDAKLTVAREQLTAYFEGKLQRFDLPLAGKGTLFQQSVWTALRDIPYGHTESYGELARRIGNHKASRAVGLANGRNPIGIIVPCHRVIGANGSLTGYAGGLERKKWLLAHEQAHMGQ